MKLLPPPIFFLSFFTILVFSCSVGNKENIVLALEIQDDFRFVEIANKFDAIIALKKSVLSATNQKNNSSFEEVMLLHEELVEIVEEVTEIYGEEIISELEYLIAIGADEPEGYVPSGGGGNDKCCEQNDNGTVDWSCCSWWETVVAGVRAGFNCTSPLEQPGADAGAYYECLQRQICRSC